MPHCSVQGSRLVQRYIEDRKLERLVREIGAAGAVSRGDAPSGHMPADPKQVMACARWGRTGFNCVWESKAVWAPGWSV